MLKKKYVIKDNKKITKFPSGFKKDDMDVKVRFDLIPYEIFERVASQFTHGGKKYGIGNWKKAKTEEEKHLFLEAAFRHILKWVHNVQDGEDHAAAAITNIMMYEWHINNK